MNSHSAQIGLIGLPLVLLAAAVISVPIARFAGLAILSYHPVALAPNYDCLAIAAGALLLGTYLSRHFDEVRKGRVSA
jgi:hypothetical protein